MELGCINVIFSFIYSSFITVAYSANERGEKPVEITRGTGRVTGDPVAGFCLNYFFNLTLYIPCIIMQCVNDQRDAQFL